MEFIDLANGKQKILFEGYIYVKQKNLAAGRISWECEKRRNAISCRAKLKTYNDILEGRTNAHTCTDLPNPARGEILKARNAMRVQAENSIDTSNNIIGTHVQQLSEAARVQLPRMETVRRTIRRVRAGDNPVAPPPADRNFVIHPSF